MAKKDEKKRVGPGRAERVAAAKRLGGVGVAVTIHAVAVLVPVCWAIVREGCSIAQNASIVSIMIGKQNPSVRIGE